MELIIERGKIYSSLDELPEYSIALDGAVQGPQIDTENHRYSFDHHSGCLRFCTTATCVQVWTAILLGLDPNRYTIFFNDVDIDISVSIWCLKNPDRCSEPQVKKLVDAVGLGDMHAGAISLNGMNKTVEWVSAPQTDAIRNGDYEKMSVSMMNSILESTLHRITMYIEGTAAAEISEQTPHGDYTVVKHDPNGWVLIESDDPHVYSSLYRAGFDRIVISRPLDNGSNAVSIAKRSDFIDNFPLPKFFEALNKFEKGWGGSTMVGGSPRNEDGSRTRLSLDDIGEIINAVIEDRDPQVTKAKKASKKKVSKKKVSKKKAE